jgi:hypothetical protein
MSVKRRLSVAGAAIVLLAMPAWAIAAGPPSDPGNGHRPAGRPTPPADPSTNHPTADSNPGTAHSGAPDAAATDEAAPPGPNAPANTKAKAYGKLCQGESHKHVKGEKGTPFSQCVTAMAKAATGTSASPHAACKGLSHKHTKGEKGTPFSRCVVAAAKLLGG